MTSSPAIDPEPGIGSRAEPGLTSTQLAAALAVLLAGYSVLNAWFAVNLGMRISGDGTLYVQGAEDLQQGRPLVELLWTRIGYISLIAACSSSGLGIFGMVIIQIVVAAIAAFALFDLARQLGGSGAGLIAAAIFLWNPDFVHWHWYILTDSLYISAVILAAWAMQWAILRSGRDRPLRYFLAGGLIAIAASIRPNGWILIIAAICFWYGHLVRSGRVRVIGIVAVVGMAAAGAFVVLTRNPDLLTNSPAAMLHRGEVIWGYEPARMSVPSSSSAAQGLPGAVTYFAQHPLMCFQLAGLRVLTELAHVRPYYSIRHNAVILCYLTPIYALAAYGLLCCWKKPLAQLLAAIVVAHLLVQAVNYADWSGRFLLYVLPLISVFAAVGVVNGFRRAKDRFQDLAPGMRTKKAPVM